MPPTFGTLLRGPPGVGNLSTRMVGAERLLARLPGVRSASIEGDIDRAAEVHLLVEEDPPVSEILDAARAALDGDGVEFPLGACFHIQVESVGDKSQHVPEDVAEDGSIRLITHQVRDVSPGVIGIDLTLGLAGHRFTGGASGKADLPGRNRVPALATLSALGSYIRFASKGGGPTLALESVSEFSLDAARVAVVVVTMSGHAAPLIASWPLTGAPGPAVVRATLEATARRVTRLSTGRDRPPGEVILRQQAESILESAGPIVSASIVLDNVEGFRIHILATVEMSRSEVSRLVMTLLEEGLGLRVRTDQITVAQSRLSRVELDRVLRRASPSTSAASSAAYVSRPALADLHIVAKLGGNQEVGVRITGGGGSFDGRCEAPGGGVALLRPLAEATLGAVAGLMRRGGREVALMLKDVRRFKRRGDDGVVVLVEATVDGRKTLSSGAAFSADSLERASVVAVLQATNAFVAGVPETQYGDEEKLEAKAVGSAAPRDPSSERRSAPPKASARPNTSAPIDYVSEVLSRLQSGTSRRPGWTAPGLPEPD